MKCTQLGAWEEEGPSEDEARYLYPETLSQFSYGCSW